MESITIGSIFLIFIWGALTGYVMNMKGYSGFIWYPIGSIISWPGLLIIWLFVPPKRR